jgi:hypothetical protein
MECKGYYWFRERIMKSIQVHVGDTLESLIEGKEAPSAKIRISIRLPNKDNDREMNKVYKEDAEQIYAVLCMFLPEGTRRYLRKMIKKGNLPLGSPSVF